MQATFNELTVFQKEKLINKLSILNGAPDILSIARICKKKNFAVDVFENCILFADNWSVQAEVLHNE